MTQRTMVSTQQTSATWWEKTIDMEKTHPEPRTFQTLLLKKYRLEQLEEKDDQLRMAAEIGQSLLRKNEALRQRLLSGELSAAALVSLPAAQLASSTQLEEREAWRKKRLRECVRKDWREGGFVTDLFRCESCGAAEARIHRTIRAGRAAVDRAATYATCKCGNRWEV